MVKIKVKVKNGSEGKPLGQYIARYEQMRAQKGVKKLYEPKARMTVHINDGRK